MKMYLRNWQGGSIVELYDYIAGILGYNSEKVEYDCIKIKVSTDIFDTVKSWYADNGCSADTFGMKWVCFGPKVMEEFAEGQVEFEEGFIIEKE